jgi:hypothetical protein
MRHDPDQEGREGPSYAPWRPPPGDPPPDRYSKPIAPPRSDLFGAFVFGLAGVVIVALMWLVAAGTLALTWALLGVAAIGGWVIGSAVGWGAWNREGPRRTHPLARILAAGFGALAWVAGTYVTYLWKLVVSAEETEPIAQRLAEQDFPRWLPSQVGPLEIAEIGLLMFFAWWTSR